MSKTRVRRILEYLRDNEPCKAKEICEKFFYIRILQHPDNPDKEYSYYPSWSGTRNHLTKAWALEDKSKQSIKLTSDGYVLTSYGRELLKT